MDSNQPRNARRAENTALEMTPSPELLPPPLPYDRRAAREILDDGVADADERRYRLYGVLRDYDRTLERGNIERTAVALRERGELLIFGRMSRAFHNQALLFADAVMVPPRRDWPEPPETVGLADRATEFALAALRLLLRSPCAVPLTLWNGSLQQFEDAVLDAQRSRLAAALQPLRSQVGNHTEYLNGAAAVVDLTPAFRDTEQHLQWAQRLRRCLLEAEHRPAAFVVVSQRPSPTGSHLLVKLNEGRDPYPGKAANLAKLFERVGDRIYGSPDYGWLEVSDHWIEAIPLFVHEETLVGTSRTTTQTVVDINGLEESFREEMADGWARNVRRVLDSEFLALARRVLAGTTEGDDDSLRGRLRAAHADSREIAALGVLFATAYRRHLAEIQRRVEQLGLEPYAAAQSVLLESTDLEQAREVRRRTGSWCSAVVAVLEPTIGCQAFEAALERLAPEAFLPRRPLPALHVLTTQSAGMTDAYVRSWLEESMALYNAVEDLGLTDAVEARRRWHDVRLHALSETLMREFGLWVEVEELRAGEGLAVEAAAQRVISRHPLLSEEVACLGTLLELHQPAPESTPPSDVADPVQVETILAQEAATLRDIALSRVLERNGPALRHRAEDYRREHPELDEREALLGVVEDDALMRFDLQVFERMAARRWLLERIDERQPEGKILDLCRSFVRRYRNLSKTTARREILAERGLQHAVSHPLYHYSATGGAKRYHLVYSPSRVDLGMRERESVETWSQWVGGADLAAMRAGKHLYQLINKDVRAFESLEEPEVLKTGENAAMASHFAYSNALGLMVTATRRGDAEEMADQMNRRRDRCVHPPGEGYGGYCVPKDGLFLEFVLSLRQGDKLSQMGLPPAAHYVAVRLAGELLEHRGEFTSEQAWSEWGAQRLRQAALIPAHARTPPLPPFLPLRCAQAMEGLGRPDLRDAQRIGTRLAARW
ncbi:MAG: hypothetical protein MUF20_01330, partial [Methylotetracoccus sp.]|nr:hypothetical protein [Methylotetracoccus sp.]